VRHRAGAHDALVHVGLERQALHVHVVAERDEAFAPVVGLVIGVLHGAQHAKDRLVLGHEALAGEARRRTFASWCFTRLEFGGFHTVQ